MKRMKWLAPAFALVLGASALFASHVPALLAQQGQQNPPISRKPACGCYVCGKLDAVEFPDKGDCAGILAEDACGQQVANFPKEKREGFCQKVKAQLKFTSFKDSCPVFTSFCQDQGQGPTKEPPEKKCEKPTPWFGGSSNCSEVQSPVVAVNAGAVTLTICGYPVFRWVPPDNDPLQLVAYKPALRDWVKTRVGSKICCDKLREAARTGVPCYPGVDVDCDGKPNQTDVDSADPNYPDINNLFSKPEGAPVAPFPQGLDPDDPDFLPPQDKCDCKWELVTGSLNCSPDGKQRHFYQARWRCPSTGNERFTRKYAAATAPCP
jgi:hypothetical protein